MPVSYSCDVCGDEIPDAAVKHEISINGTAKFLDNDCYEEIIEQSETFKALVFDE
jgi:hypothetical protein